MDQDQESRSRFSGGADSSRPPEPAGPEPSRASGRLTASVTFRLLLAGGVWGATQTLAPL